ncbi:DUF1015 family protein [Pelomyxa schiedti]|nr:DUF1015 family protein [Pelomyxa schiedti]
MQAARVPTVLLPANGSDLRKWSTVACDQYTAEPQYWAEVERIVGAAPSTLRMIYPEVYLNEDETSANKRIAAIQGAMTSYLAQGLLVPHNGFILVERVSDGHLRHGLMIEIDLEKYEFSPRSQTLIRPTEGTIVERLPPRIKIRTGAKIEVPHILVLIDDPHHTVIEPLVATKGTLPKLYDVELMMEGGHLTGYSVPKPLEANVCAALDGLATPAAQASKYGPGKNPLIYAVGDGNHSLATAKRVWEMHKENGADPNTHPARWALVELENVHDSGLHFAPIHRVCFNTQPNILDQLRDFYGAARFVFEPCAVEEMVTRVKANANTPPHKFGFVSQSACGVVTIKDPTHTLAVGTLQPALDALIPRNNIDYVHGDNVVVTVGKEKPGNCGFFLPAMNKSDLFIGVVEMGVVPRKTFSMGEANEKRYYFECRAIIP